MIPKAETNKTSPLHRRLHHIRFTITTVSTQQSKVFSEHYFETDMDSHVCFTQFNVPQSLLE
ncbi:hypothetical protein OUZ56_017769 [Daphnia magna]|uniref:Uncharacterized protein n=1 Tax=Daphnia magna TaxID=35525 RepID=A0ABR0ATQ2_9CRUS|nr:hypothetical protein OUZ56_017769 [Daphnia magna]